MQVADAATASRAPENTAAMVKKIGKTTYKVHVHFSNTSTETMSDKIKRMANTCPQTKEQKMQRQKARSEIANAKPKGKRQVKASQGNTSYGKMVKQDKPFVKKQNTHTEQKPTAK